MSTKISRQAYAEMFGPTVGDRLRLADTELFVEVEKDYTLYGEEVKFGGGKVIRDGMGQSQRISKDTADTVITNALIIDAVTGIVKADIGIKEGRIVGIQKSSGLNNIDASLIEVNLMTPLTVIGYSKEDVAKIQKDIPYMSFLERPKGSIKEFPDVGPIWEECPIAGAVATAAMSEEVGYKIVKAYFEGFAEVASAYGPVKGFDPVADYFKYAGDDVVPAHAGLVRYAKERGIDVPARFIPPEYKGTK